eukprot:4137809-Karenia_brevis.AAC.1
MEQQLAQILAQQQQQMQQTNDLLQQLTLSQTANADAIQAMQMTLAQTQQQAAQVQAETVGALQAVASQAARPQGGMGVVDVTKVGKPDHLKGAGKSELRKAWPDWSYIFKTWFNSQWKHADAILKWAQDQYDVQIDNAALEMVVRATPAWKDEILAISRQLHVSLT